MTTTLLKSAKPLNSGVTLDDIESFTHYAEGSFREVRTSPAFPGMVLKVSNGFENEEEDYTSEEHQEYELQVWSTLCEDGFDDFVPAHDVLHDGERLILIVEYVEFLHYEDVWELTAEYEVVQQYAADLILGINSGFTEEGRFVVRDAGCSKEFYENWLKNESS